MQSVSEANSRAPDCDSGCRGFKTRFSPVRQEVATQL